MRDQACLSNPPPAIQDKQPGFIRLPFLLQKLELLFATRKPKARHMNL
jgi:hypothetical protein